MPCNIEALTRQFYEWERRGRGWQVWERPVALEPPFRPFLGYSIPQEPVVDDGCKPTFLSSLVQRLSKAIATKPPPQPPEVPEPEEEPEPTILEREAIVEFQVSLPPKVSTKPEAFAKVLCQLFFCKEPVSFEIIGTAERIITQFAVCPEDAAILRRQLKAHLPEALVIETSDVLKCAWIANGDVEDAIVDFGLREEFFIPLARPDHDPFISLIGTMSELAPNELAVFQVIFKPVANQWAESINRAVTDAIGKPFFVNEPELTQKAQEKTSCPLFAAVVRIATQADTHEHAWIMARDLACALRAFARIDGNELIDLSNGFGPIFFGHSPDFVTKAVKEQLDIGIETGPQSPMAGEVAELFCELTGHDRCCFANTGSETVIGAVRLARTVTGRPRATNCSRLARMRRFETPV